MPNDNNDSIRYLMKEMDPSEEVLMERSMMEDEDLLIEVECMRQTLNKLDKNLPKVEPPPDVTQAVINKAAKHKKQKRSSGIIPVSLGSNGIGYIAAAAVVAVGLISGSLLYQDLTESSANDGNAQENTASVNIPTTINSFFNSTDPRISPVETTEIEPWVDRNEVLRFQEHFGEESNAAFDSIMNSATKKLKPINDSQSVNTRARQFQLTGSEQ